MTRRRKYWAAAAAIFALGLAVSVAAWLQLPADARIAIHFSGGEADRYSGRTFAALAMPLVLLAVLGAGDLVARKKDQAGTATAIVLVAAAVLLIVHVAILANALGWSAGVGDIVMLISGAAMIAIGALLPKTKRNLIVGVRIPATLSDEHKWRRVNRITGMAFILLGSLVVVMTPFAGTTLQRILILGGLAAVAIVAIASTKTPSKRS